MFNVLRDTYTVNGVAADQDTLFRIRPQVVGYAYSDMFDKGYEPVEGTMEANWVNRRDGKVSFTLSWKCREWKAK